MTEHILTGPPCKFVDIDKGIGEFFFEQAEKLGDKVFQIDADSGKQETYHDVKRRSTRVAIYLDKAGIKPKDRILLCCLNNLDNIIPVFASLYLGAYVASVDPKQSVSEVKNAMTQLEPKVVFVEKNSLDLVEKSIQEANQKPLIIVLGNITSGKYPNMWDIEKDGSGENNFRPLKQKGKDIAAILFSSGTTATPKGICLTNSAFLNVIQSLIQHNAFKARVFLHLTPFIWVSAWFMTVTTFMTASAKVVTPGIGGEQFFKIVDKYRITHVMCNPTFTYKLTELDEATASKYDTSSLFTIALGGSVIDPQQIIKLRKYLPHTNVNLVYGSTEANFVSNHNYADHQEMAKEKVLSCGILLPEVQMKIVDSATGKQLGPHQQGEIRIKSKYSMAGYYNLTKPDLFDKEGFLKIGDIGYYDEDGHVYVSDRINEMFKYVGFHISPAELEAVLYQHPAVEHAVVFGVPHNIDMNHAAACVVLKSDATASVDELLSFFNNQVSDIYQLRGGLLIVKSIPLTPSGKYQRRTIREYFIKMKG